MIVQSPVGPLSADSDGQAITRLIWGPAGNLTTGPLADQFEREVTEYFAGTRQAFTLPLAPRGTSFQQDFYAALCAIPYGETRTYGDLAGDLTQSSGLLSCPSGDVAGEPGRLSVRGGRRD